MNFDKWQDSRKYVDLYDQMSDLVFEEGQWGFIYPGDCFIEDAYTWTTDRELVKTRWYLVIENHQYISNDLKELEVILFSWAEKNIFVQEII